MRTIALTKIWNRNKVYYRRYSVVLIMKWISIWQLVPVLFRVSRSPGRNCQFGSCWLVLWKCNLVPRLAWERGWWKWWWQPAAILNSDSVYSNHLVFIIGLVVLTTMAGYSLAPGEFSAMTCALASVGTMLCSCSANTFNQVIPYYKLTNQRSWEKFLATHPVIIQKFKIPAQIYSPF
jgi:hypothetical protein